MNASGPAEPTTSFLDVGYLIDASRPHPRGVWFMPAVGAFLLLVLGSAYLSGRSQEWGKLIDAVSFLLMLGIVGSMLAAMFTTVRRQRLERQRIESIEELVQLRRWPQAAATVQQLLSRPTRTPFGRVQGLIFLAVVLSRYNRFNDAIAVQGYLLENVPLDPATQHALRLGRAMAMLREDHLFDADRAISELRRDVSRATQAMAAAAETAAEQTANGEPNRATANDESNRTASSELSRAAQLGQSVVLQTNAAAPLDPPEAPVSAGLALIEIYRDVKTGHPTEAIAMFNQTLPALRSQLGHRVADAYALVAFAYDFLGKPSDAQTYYERATLLSPPMEMQRRYPELASVISKYQPALAPAEAA